MNKRGFKTDCLLNTTQACKVMFVWKLDTRQVFYSVQVRKTRIAAFMCSVVLVLNIVFNMSISNFIWTMVTNNAIYQMNSLSACETD